MQMKLFGIISADFDAVDQLLIIFLTFVRYRMKNIGMQWENTSTVYRLYEDV
jgi:hypothetical protein